MLHIEEQRPLSGLTTFKIGGPARYFLALTSAEDLPEALDFARERGLPTLVIGGGSNMLISDAGYPGLVIQMAIKGIELRNVPGDPTTVELIAKAGEVWDDVVADAVGRGLWGIENLSRIPGTAGSVPVQNVGAYGQEAKDVVSAVDVYDRQSGSFRTLSKAECQFGYRTSIFNTSEKGRYIILATHFLLSREPHRVLGYPDLEKYFAGHTAPPTEEEIRVAIRTIRDRKFPFPAEAVEGNAGSFFKNALLTDAELDMVREHFRTNLPEFMERFARYDSLHTGAATHKLPGAFVLEACGLKGFRMGDAMLNPEQPIVVLNATGRCSAREVLELVREVRRIVREKTGLHLLTEPDLLGFTADELSGYGFSAAEIARYAQE